MKIAGGDKYRRKYNDWFFVIAVICVMVRLLCVYVFYLISIKAKIYF